MGFDRHVSDAAGDRATYVIVTTSFPECADGSEAAGSFIADMAEELARHVAVRVVAPGAVAGEQEWKPGIRVFRYAAPKKPLSTLKFWRPTDLAWIPRILRGGLVATRRALAGARVVHVLALWGLPSGEWARRAVRGSGIPYSAWMLGSDVWSLGRLPGLRGMLARVVRDAAHAYADGHQLAEAASDIAGGLPVAFLPSTRSIGLSSRSALRAQPPYRLLFLGRWHVNKGVDLLLEALALLSEADWSRIESVRIEGGGPLEPSVRAMAAELAARGRPVRAGGFLSKDQAEQAFVEADWLLIPSRIESIPVVFSDAMKLGCPVVIMPVGDLPRLMEYGVGIAATQVASAAFARAIGEALDCSSASYDRGLRRAAAVFDLPGVIVPRLLADAGYRGDAEGAQA